ncbi:hypothetical protein [Roseivivax sp.]
MSGVHVEPLEAALSRYFERRGKARAELQAVLDYYKYSPELCKCAHRLQSALQSCSMMSRREEADLSRLLRALERDIAAGTSQRYVDDEYCMSGGGYETVLTDSARRLTKIKHDLGQLQSAWCRVEQAIAVDRELLRLRG